MGREGEGGPTRGFYVETTTISTLYKWLHKCSWELDYLSYCGWYWLDIWNGNKDPSEISLVMNNELRCLTDCIIVNKLFLNKSTTKLLIFRPTSNLILIILSINQELR